MDTPMKVWPGETTTVATAVDFAPEWTPEEQRAQPNRAARRAFRARIRKALERQHRGRD